MTQAQSQNVIPTSANSGMSHANTETRTIQRVHVLRHGHSHKNPLGCQVSSGVPVLLYFLKQRTCLLAAALSSQLGRTL